ncbi:MAG: hypothetical protein ACRDPI_05790, partial [Nocardioidaceae bacterium]
MSQTPAFGHPTRRGTRRALSRRWSRAVRRFRHSETTTVIVVGLLTLVLAWLAWRFATPTGFTIPVTVLMVPMVLADLLLSPRSLPWVVAFILLVLVAVVLLTSPEVLVSRRIGALITA